MKILLTVFLVFCFQTVVSAQAIMIYFKGEQKIMKLSELKKEKDYVNNSGMPCGEYFVYKESPSQKFVSFALDLTGRQELPLGEHPEDLAVALIEFKPDKTALFATAEWFRTKNPKMMLIRLPPKEYKAISKCLPIAKK